MYNKIKTKNKMKKIEGDLIRLCRAGKFNLMVHGCNCFNTMGGGIARQVRAECPEAWLKDQQTIPGDKNKLGTITYSLIEPKDARDSEFHCVNGYTQYDFGTDKMNVDYNAVRKVMKRVCSLFPDKKIGMPLIGAGLAGGDWNVIEKIIQEELVDKGVDVTIVLFRK